MWSGSTSRRARSRLGSPLFCPPVPGSGVEAASAMRTENRKEDAERLLAVFAFRLPQNGCTGRRQAASVPCLRLIRVRSGA